MPFAAITAAGVGSALAGGAAAAAGGILASDVLGGSGGGQSAGSNLASGAAGIAGDLLSDSEAQGLANVASPYNQYAGASASNLSNQAAAGNYGQNSTASQNILTNFANNTGAQTNQYIAPAEQAASQGAAGLNGLSLSGINSQISNLIQNPSSIYQTPQYQAAFNQGQGAVNSTLAAQGLNASGNQLAALQSYGQSFGQNAYNTQLSQLSGLSNQAAGQQQQSYSQLAGGAQLALQGNQQAYGQLAGANQGALATNNQGYNQLTNLAGVGNNPAAANLLLGQYNATGSSIGAGIGQLAQGAGQLANQYSGSGSPDYGGFSSGLGTSTSGSGISGSGALYGTSAGQSGADYTYGGSNSFGFTE